MRNIDPVLLDTLLNNLFNNLRNILIIIGSIIVIVTLSGVFMRNINPNLLDVLRNISIIIGSIIAIVTLIVHICSSRSVARQQIWTSIFLNFQEINNYISNKHEHLIKPPYPELKSGQVTGMLLLHHLNLIFRYWTNRKLLEKDEKNGLDRWMKIVFFKWIESHPYLSSDLETILEFKDLYPEKFINWMIKCKKYYDIGRLAKTSTPNKANSAEVKSYAAE